MLRRVIVRLVLVFASILTLAACALIPPRPTGSTAVRGPISAPAPANKDIILATTTSTQDSGLLDVLIPPFEQQTGYRVKTIAVGSGQAMAMGEHGEADVLLVHAPDAEVRFMAAGHGIRRALVMHNDFVIVGPPSDPAGVAGATTAAEALARIAERKALFVSRGDNSGTDQLEKKLWSQATIDTDGQTWYQETGSGMGQTLNVASEKAGYTVADRGTFLARQKTLELRIIFEGEKSLLNVYHAIVVNPAKNDQVNAAGAVAFVEFLIATEAQDIIGRFGVSTFGQPLFFPDAGKDEPTLGA